MSSQMSVSEETGRSLVVRLRCTLDVGQPSGVPPSPPAVGEIDKLKLPKSLETAKQNWARAWNVTVVCLGAKKQAYTIRSSQHEAGLRGHITVTPELGRFSRRITKSRPDWVI